MAASTFDVVIGGEAKSFYPTERDSVNDLLTKNARAAIDAAEEAAAARRREIEAAVVIDAYLGDHESLHRFGAFPSQDLPDRCYKRRSKVASRQSAARPWIDQPTGWRSWTRRQVTPSK